MPRLVAVAAPAAERNGPVPGTLPPAAPPPAHAPPGGLRRMRVAVLAADVAGYTRLMEAREEETHALLMHIEAAVVGPVVAARGGRVVKHTGDGFLASFGAAREATLAAMQIQEEVARLAAAAPEAPPIAFRMGLNLTNAIVEPHDIFGDGVNLAARLQAYAAPGGVLATGAVAEEVAGLKGLAAIDLGDLFPKNLSRPVRVYAIRPAEGAAAAPLPPRPPEAEERASIAVLPFREAGTAPEDAYFAEGIIEGITEVLAGLEGITVIARSTAQAYAGRRADVRSVGRELGVRYVLNGQVRRSGERLRIATELADAETGAVIRTERHDATMAELFELQDRISTEVVAAIAPQIRERELARAMRKHPESMTAYDLLLQAVDQFFRLDGASFARAHGLLQQALSHDPGYAAALAYTAWWHIVRVSQGWSPDTEADKAEARRNAEAAVARDPNSALALAAHGHLLSWVREHGRAARVLERAVELGPNHPGALAMSSVTCGFLGDGARAVIRAERALKLSPRDPFLFWYEHILSQAHYVNGNHEEAARWGLQAAERNGRLTSNLRTVAAALVAAGRIEEARWAARRQLEVEPHFRLGVFAARTPLEGRLRDEFVARLREAGLPD
jgi:adenylate cyclase